MRKSEMAMNSVSHAVVGGHSGSDKFVKLPGDRGEPRFFVGYAVVGCDNGGDKSGPIGVGATEIVGCVNPIGSSFDGIPNQGDFIRRDRQGVVTVPSFHRIGGSLVVKDRGVSAFMAVTVLEPPDGMAIYQRPALYGYQGVPSALIETK